MNFIDAKRHFLIEFYSLFLSFKKIVICNINRKTFVTRYRINVTRKKQHKCKKKAFKNYLRKCVYFLMGHDYLEVL